MIDKEKRNKRQNEWQKEQKDRLNLLLPKGTKAEIEQAAAGQGLSMAAFILEAVREKLSRGEKERTREREEI